MKNGNLFGTLDIERSFTDELTNLNQALKDSIQDSIQSEYYQIQYWQCWTSLAMGAKENSAEKTMVAIIPGELNEKLDLMIGYFDQRKFNFKPQKNLEPGKDGTPVWKPAKRGLEIDQKEIYAIMRVRHDYVAETKETQEKMIAKIDFFMNPDFQKDGYTIPVSDLQRTYVSTENQSVATGSETPNFTSTPHSSQADTRQSEMNTSFESTKSEMSCIEVENTQILDGLQYFETNDYNYLNVEEWPRKGFDFFAKEEGGLGYICSTEGGTMTKVKSRSQIYIKLANTRENQESGIEKGRRVKWCFDDEYDYFVAPLDDQMKKKVYTQAFFKENFELLKYILEQKRSPNEEFDEEQFDMQVMHKLQKHYGFLEIFKRAKNGTNYEESGKLQHVSY